MPFPEYGPSFQTCIGLHETYIPPQRTVVASMWIPLQVQRGERYFLGVDSTSSSAAGNTNLPVEPPMMAPTKSDAKQRVAQF